MRVQAKKWGNSIGVRIPAAVMAAAHFEVDQMLEMREEAGKIIIEPAATDPLDDMLAGITSDNLHAPVSMGAPVGNEEF